MAALDFPNSPTNGQQYAASNGATYTWDGAVWVTTGTGSGTGPPSGPATGDLTGTYPSPVVSKSSAAPFTVPGDASNAIVQLGNITAKTRMLCWNIGGPGAALYYNRNAANAQDDPTKVSWGLQIPNAVDAFVVQRQPAGSSTPITLFGVENTGSISISTRTIKNRLIASATVDGAWWTANADLQSGSWVQDDAAKSSWIVDLNLTTNLLAFLNIPPAGTQKTLMAMDSAGVFNLYGDPALTLGANVVLGGGTAKGRVQAVSTGTNTGAIGLYMNRNFNFSNVQDDAAKPSWGFSLSPLGDNAAIQRSPAGSTTQTNVFIMGGNGDLVISGAVATKASGTAWVAASDRRIKDEIEDYPTGLDAILQLQPRTFLYNGKAGSTEGMRGYGFVADEIATVMPETVGVQPRKLDPEDEEDTDIQILDQSNLTLALVNAVQELATRVTALEEK